MSDPSNINSVLFLGPADVKDVITMDKAIDLVEEGYRGAVEFPLINAPRRRVHSPEGVRVSNFPGGIAGLGVIGSLTRAESVSHDPDNQVYPYREHPVYLLWDSETSRLNAIMVGEITEKRVGFSSVMALRTGATTGVGIRHLARADCETVGVYGTGGQALHKVLACSCERDIKKYKIYSRDPGNREAFIEKLTPLVDAEFEDLDDPREVCRDTDIVICATNSNVPVFDGDWLEEGQHVITVVGSNNSLVKGGWLDSGRRENDDRTCERASFIVTNWRESVIQDGQAGLMEPIEAGVITWDKIVELGEIISGAHPGRTSPDEITYHANNNGTAASDLAIAQWVYEKCLEMDRGQKIEIPVPGTQ
ncbi:MAG: ornithine cyclodeaminase family protein [Alphaproteobacteria bacterium]|nr:ornithine cyclodeaminase family protein [Alphaproteobacteria bacterium]MCZ6742801.1 ornithine cyclodeaminase family protein [Alphaproteobacteria bacterium]MCZ6813650.1 ornithine cyclodeaminase family protein [Alphaproteobacteria bacterium]